MEQPTTQINTAPVSTSYVTCGALTVFALLIGAGVGIALSSYLPPSLGNYSRGYTEGFAAARAVVEKSSLGAMYLAPNDVRSLVGIVTSTGENQITIQMDTMDPFADPMLANRTVLVNASTLISSQTLKELTALRDEMASYIKSLQGTSTVTQTQPVAFTQTSGDISSIKVGDAVTVKTSENVKEVQEFTAQEIQIQARAAPSAP